MKLVSYYLQGSEMWLHRRMITTPREDAKRNEDVPKQETNTKRAA